MKSFLCLSLACCLWPPHSFSEQDRVGAVRVRGEVSRDRVGAGRSEWGLNPFAQRAQLCTQALGSFCPVGDSSPFPHPGGPPFSNLHPGAVINWAPDFAIVLFSFHVGVLLWHAFVVVFGM